MGVLAKPAAAEDAKPAEQAPAASTEEMMARYAALAEPAPEHKILAMMAGTFTADCTSVCDPSGQPQKFEGTQTRRMILGGRFLQSDFKGEMMGMSFEGHGMIGYDNVKKKYISLWTDTMGTAWMTSEGEASTAGGDKVITVTGSYDDPVTGKNVTMRQVTALVDNDHHTFEMHGLNPDPTRDGAEMKMMEIKYTRKP